MRAIKAKMRREEKKKGDKYREVVGVMLFTNDKKVIRVKQPALTDYLK